MLWKQVGADAYAAGADDAVAAANRLWVGKGQAGTLICTREKVAGRHTAFLKTPVTNRHENRGVFQLQDCS